jgi:hypothetical protein
MEQNACTVKQASSMIMAMVTLKEGADGESRVMSTA